LKRHAGGRTSGARLAPRMARSTDLDRRERHLRRWHGHLGLFDLEGLGRGTSEPIVSLSAEQDKVDPECQYTNEDV
jgi:hypothetical protein